MDFAQARAQFPVLEHFAYLNAGTFGPLARATVEAMEEQAAARSRARALGAGLLRRGRRACATRCESGSPRWSAPRRRRSPSPARPPTAATSCWPGSTSRPEDEVVTTADEHFGLLGPLHASRRPHRRGGARARGDPGCRHSAHEAARALAGALDGRARPSSCRVRRSEADCPCSWTAPRRSERFRSSAAGLDFLTVSAQKWLCGPDTVGALFVRDPERLRIAQPSYFAQKSFEPDGSFEPRAGAARFDSQWIAPASLAGLLAALDARPDWAFERAAEMTELCRSALAERFEVVSLPGQGTLVSWRAGRRSDRDGQAPVRAAASSSATSRAGT